MEAYAAVRFEELSDTVLSQPFVVFQVSAFGAPGFRLGSDTLTCRVILSAKSFLFAIGGCRLRAETSALALEEID